MLFSELLIAQTKSAKKATTNNKAKSALSTTNADVISIKVDSVHKISGESPLPGYSYVKFNVNIKFIVKGYPPQSDIPIKLLINSDYTNVDAEFDTYPASKSIVISFDKSLFKKDGDTATVSRSIPIRYNPLKNAMGNAYISIYGKDSLYATLNFDNAVKKGNVSNFSFSDTSRANTNTLRLNPFNKNYAEYFTVKLNFKLNKGTGDSTSTPVTVEPAFGKSLKNIDLSPIGQKLNYVVKFESKDWNTKKDTIVSKTISLYLRQTVIVKDTQYVALKNGKGTQIIKILPNSVKGLIKSGQVDIVPRKIGITQDFGTKINSTNYIKMKVKFSGDYDEVNNQLAFDFVDPSLSKYFSVSVDSNFNVGQRVWQQGSSYGYNKRSAATSTTTTPNKDANNTTGESKKKKSIDTTKKTSIDTSGILIPVIIKTTNLNDSLSKIHYIDLKIKGQKEIDSHIQRIELNFRINNYWVEVGYNFNQLSSLKGSFYGGIYMFEPDLVRIHQIKWLDNLFRKKTEENDTSYNLGFAAGLYESESITTFSTSTSFLYKTPGSYTKGTMGYPLALDTGTTNVTTTVQNIGMFIEPLLRLTKGETNVDGAHVFVAGYSEMIWQRLTSNFDYSKTGTVHTTYDTTTNNATFLNAPFQKGSLSLDYRSLYFGPGVVFYFKATDFNIYINWIPWGRAQQQFAFVTDNTSAQYINNYNVRPIPGTNGYNIYLLDIERPMSNWNSFYLAQFRFNVVSLGLAVTGEVRGLFNSNTKPIIILGISKKINLDKLLSPVLGPL